MRGIRDPNTTFISRSTARKYFGDADPMGQSIKLDNKTVYQINGVFEDIPDNSHIKFDIVLPWANLLDLPGTDFDDSWGDSGAFTYILFRKGVDMSDFQKKLDEIADREFGEALRYYKLTMKLPLQPITDIHLTSHYQQELEPGGDRSTVNLLLAIAFIILGIAWVNYINLSTARAMTRAKEVGLRKVAGASRIQLIFQFFLEVLIMNLMALAVTIIILSLVLHIMAPVTGTPVSYSIWDQNWLWPAFSIFLLAGVILSGFYPVALMSSFMPLQVLTGKPGNSTKEICIRNIMGAGTARILLLFGREFLILILIAFLISSILCYAGINLWLNSYATRMPVTIWIFILPFILVVLIAGLTIGSQVLKVARTNPADTLRYE